MRVGMNLALIFVGRQAPQKHFLVQHSSFSSFVHISAIYMCVLYDDDDNDDNGADDCR